jgi:hypothetical protein
VSRIAYVSGRLGAGKSSLAFPLAAELGYSLVTKDLIKETLHDALYVPGDGEIDREWSQRLGDRPVGIGPLITVDTTGPVDVASVAAEVRRLHARQTG